MAPRQASKSSSTGASGRLQLAGSVLLPEVPFRSASLGALSYSSKSLSGAEAAEVRALAGDAPLKGEGEEVDSPHDSLLARLKSRAARAEAEGSRAFIALYREEVAPSPASEQRLDALLRSTAQHAEELKQRSEELQLEASEAERRLERTSGLAVPRAADAELAALTPFERSQRRVLEDKKEQELQRQRDEAQTAHAKAHRRLQSELIELRDYKVLLREFRHLRLEKLYATLGRVSTGRQLRACVREMIRHGAQRIVQRLESSPLVLETWMREVLVNSCHVEMRVEAAEAKLLLLRRRALQPVKQGVELLLKQTEQQRFESLCARATERMRAPSRGASTPGDQEVEGPEDGVFAEIKEAEVEIAALRRLLGDMRHNTAALVMHEIRRGQAEDWGMQVLSLLVSEDFAKASMKEMQKSKLPSSYTQ